jgi:hypothetical protein
MLGWMDLDPFRELFKEMFEIANTRISGWLMQITNSISSDVI